MVELSVHCIPVEEFERLAPSMHTIRYWEKGKYYSGLLTIHTKDYRHEWVTVEAIVITLFSEHNAEVNNLPEAENIP